MARDLKPRTPVAERLVTARLHLQLGREELAAALDWNKSTLAKYEQGASQPDFGFLDRLQEKFGISLDWVITGRGKMLGGHTEKPNPSPSMTSGIDEALLDRIANEIAEVYRAENARIYPLQLVNLAGRWYADLVAATETPEERTTGLNVMLQQLRRDLRNPQAPGGANSKRLA